MTTQGAVLEDFGTHDAKGVWELRIALANAQYITFFRNVDSDAGSIILSALVGTVQRGLEKSLDKGDAPEPEVVRIQPAAELYYTARATVGGSKVSR